MFCFMVICHLEETITVTSNTLDMSVQNRTTTTTTATNPKANAPSTFQSTGLSTNNAIQNNSGQQNRKGTLGTHVRNSSLDYRIQPRGFPYSCTSFLDLRHVRNNSSDLMTKLHKNDITLVFGPQQASSWVDPLRVQIIKAHTSTLNINIGTINCNVHIEHQYFHYEQQHLLHLMLQW